ncbi:MAG: L,D-transpeptidase, partial [Clostridiales bacterium]|nr:L,D-transpeptidase [Clostridiales bacterium]
MSENHWESNGVKEGRERRGRFCGEPQAAQPDRTAQLTRARATEAARTTRTARTAARTVGLTAFARLFPLLLTLSLVFAAAGPPIAASAIEAEPGRAGVNFGTGESPFYLYVEKGSFSITVFYKDADGNYTIPLRTFPTAIGRSARMTPTGVFHKGRTELWHSWGSTWSPYASAYSPGLYVHGPI